MAREIVTIKDGRRFIGIGARYYTTYARHLMTVALGRMLTWREVVHHKDGNPLNDVLSNLELVTQKHHKVLHKKLKK